MDTSIPLKNHSIVQDLRQYMRTEVHKGLPQLLKVTISFQCCKEHWVERRIGPLRGVQLCKKYVGKSSHTQKKRVPEEWYFLILVA